MRVEADPLLERLELKALKVMTLIDISGRYSHTLLPSVWCESMRQFLEV